MAGLRGEIEQTPPMYSAKKIAGQKLYELARRGKEVERQTVRVTISKFEAMTPDGVLLRLQDEETSNLAVRVVCSAGTYVRTLAEDWCEFAAIEERIAEAEQTLQTKRAALNDPAISSDGPRLLAVSEELEEAQRIVDLLYARWAELEAKQDW